MAVRLLYDKGKLFKKAEKTIKGFKNITRDPRFVKEVAVFTKAMMLKRILNGYGVDKPRAKAENRRAQRFPVLSSNYVKQRKKASLGPEATPGKSNLSFSGQLLGAMRESYRGYGFRVYIAATRRKRSKITNSQLAKYIAKNNSRSGVRARPFMALTGSEASIVKSLMKKLIKKRLKKRR